MTVLSADAIDRELASRTAEVAAITATLLELEDHPGLQHMRNFPPSGMTAQRWAVVGKSLGELWEDLGRMTSILDSARTVRARRAKPANDDRAELTRWLRGRPLEVSRERIPLAQRVITSAGETVDYVGLADIADRLRGAYPAVAEFFDAVDEVDSLVAERLAPSQKRLDAAGVAGPKELADLLAVSATDPLSLTANEIEDRIRIIARGIERRSVEITELAALQENWPDALTATARQLDVLRDATRQAAQVRTHAQQSVLTGPLPMHEDAEPGLRIQFASITAPDPAALLALRHGIEAARRIAEEHGELAQGLLDRRTELNGRLTAYKAKAARLGMGEDSDLLAVGRIAAGLLSRRPCDLRAVTRSIADFQQMILQKQARSR